MSELRSIGAKQLKNAQVPNDAIAENEQSELQEYINNLQEYLQEDIWNIREEAATTQGDNRAKGAEKGEGENKELGGDGEQRRKFVLTGNDHTAEREGVATASNEAKIHSCNL